eukprot:9984530-Alexandrium_andersonii.AAC.1
MAPLAGDCMANRRWGSSRWPGGMRGWHPGRSARSGAGCAWCPATHLATLAAGSSLGQTVHCFVPLLTTVALDVLHGHLPLRLDFAQQ